MGLKDIVLSLALSQPIVFPPGRPVVEFPSYQQSDIKLDINDATFAYLQYQDLITTFKGIDKGLAEEGNPLAVSLFGKDIKHRTTARLFKLGFTGLVVGAANYLRNQNPEEERQITTIPLNLLFAYVVGSNAKLSGEDVAPFPIATIPF